MKKIFILLLSFLIVSTAFAQTRQKSKSAVAKKTHTAPAKGKITAKKKAQTGKQATVSKTKKKPSKKSAVKPIPPLLANNDSLGDPVVDNLLTILTHELGKPYRLGSNGPTGFDCSGLIKFAFSFIGVALPRTASDIGQLGEKITLNDLHPGDLLFFSGRRPSRSSIGHVGCVYKVDSGKVYMIHSSKEGVNILDINSDEYYKKRFICAKRIFGPDSCYILPVKAKG